jgi:hypothetical protein
MAIANVKPPKTIYSILQAAGIADNRMMALARCLVAIAISYPLYLKVVRESSVCN